MGQAAARSHLRIQRAGKRTRLDFLLVFDEADLLTFKRIASGAFTKPPMGSGPLYSFQGVRCGANPSLVGSLRRKPHREPWSPAMLGGNTKPQQTWVCDSGVAVRTGGQELEAREDWRPGSTRGQGLEAREDWRSGRTGGR